MSNLDHRGLVTQAYDDTHYWEASPFIQGFFSAVKGALVGGAAGAAVGAISGKSPVAGMLLGAAGGGLLSGAAKSVSQDLSNTSTESTMRYHNLRLKGREPLLFFPPEHLFGRLFHKYHNEAHRVS